jgi:hypothetical protein
LKALEIQGEVELIETRVYSAEQKITDTAIVNTVRSSTSYIDDLNGKVSTDSIISSINQTAEEITIDASKIKLEGLTTINGDFKVYTDGSIFARNAEIGGTINAIDGSIGAMDIYDGLLEQSVFEYNPHGDIGYNVSFGIGEPDWLGFYSDEVISVNRGEPGVYQVGRSDTPTFTVSKYGDVYAEGNAHIEGNLEVGGVDVGKGVIVESGSTPNGEYIKYGDGTMVCTAYLNFSNIGINNAHGSLYRSGTITWIFPKEFVGDRPYASAKNNITAQPCWDVGHTLYHDRYQFYLYSAVSHAARDRWLALEAVGRWKMNAAG